MCNSVMLIFFSSQHLTGAYFHITVQHPSVFFFGGFELSPFVSFIVTGCESWCCCWCCVPTTSNVVPPDVDVGVTPFLWPPFCCGKDPDVFSRLLVVTWPFVWLGVSVLDVLSLLLLLDCEFFRFCSSNFPSRQSFKSSSASWLISPSGRNGLSQPS